MQGLMVRSNLRHTASVVEEHNTVLCSPQLENAGLLLAFDGGVGGHKVNM